MTQAHDAGVGAAADGGQHVVHDDELGVGAVDEAQDGAWDEGRAVVERELLVVRVRGRGERPRRRVNGEGRDGDGRGGVLVEGDAGQNPDGAHVAERVEDRGGRAAEADGL
jgi:hypothetical protein